MNESLATTGFKAVVFRHLGHYGRLGNQMFQLAALIGVANHYGVQWGYPKTNDRLPSTISMYGEHCVLPYLFPSIRDLNRWEDDWDDRTCRFVESTEDYDSGLALMNSLKAPVASTSFARPSTLDLHGYFQSEGFFSKTPVAIESVRNAFRFSDSVLAETARFPVERYAGFAGLHVRRGDYLRLSHVLPPLPAAYYRSAMASMPAAAGFLVFGCTDQESRQWAKANLVDDAGRPVVLVDDVRKPVHPDQDIAAGSDMHLFSTLSQVAISNSTFAWWGAWLNEDRIGKNVFAPKTWFGPRGPKASCLVPERWRTL